MTTLMRVGIAWIGGAWLGGMLFFAFVIAPTVFTVLPSPEIANRVVGPALFKLNVFGMVAGPVLAGLAVGLGRHRALLILPLLLAAVSAFSEFVITARIAQILPHTLGPDSGAGDAVEFANLHRLSMLVFSGLLLGVFALLAGHAHADRDSGARWH